MSKQIDKIITNTFKDQGHFSLREVGIILNNFEGFKTMEKVRAILKYGGYKLDIHGDGNGQRYRVPRSTVIKIISDIEDGTIK